MKRCDVTRIVFVQAFRKTDETVKQRPALNWNDFDAAHVTFTACPAMSLNLRRKSHSAPAELACAIVMWQIIAGLTCFLAVLHQEAGAAGYRRLDGLTP
jgi:hypothetical protein